MEDCEPNLHPRVWRFSDGSLRGKEKTGTTSMKRTIALTAVLALASLGVSAYAKDNPAGTSSTTQTQSGKKQKKQHTKKAKKTNTTTDESAAKK
jgi:hypothetical protein